MGNVGSNSSGSNGRRRQGGRRGNHPPPAAQENNQPDISNRFVFAAATPYPTQYPNAHPGYYQYPGGVYYPPPPPPAVVPLPPPHHRVAMDPSWVGVGGRYPCVPIMHHPTPYVDHQKAVTIRNDVNLKKETLKIEADQQDPGKFLVSFTFDATVACSITLYFFAKEGKDCKLSTHLHPPISVTFEQGLGQKFKQTPGTGIDLSTYEAAELSKGDETSIYPLAVKAEAMLENGVNNNNNSNSNSNSQITDAVFEKVKGEFKVRVVKQILWVNGTRYELQEIYGIGNSIDGGEFDANDPGKECVICLSEPRDTTVLPCRHMCMCSGCAKVLRFQTNRCPICRQSVERLLEIKVNNGGGEEKID